MADDPLFSGTPSGETVLDYLGRPAPVSFAGQPALPVGGPAVGTPTGPTTVGGTGIPTSILPSIMSVPGAGPMQGRSLKDVMTALGALEQGKKLTDIAGTIFGADKGVGAIQTPSGQLTTSAPEILRDSQFPNFVGSETQAGALGGEAAAAIPTEVTAGIEAGVVESPSLVASASQAIADFSQVIEPFMGPLAIAHFGAEVGQRFARGDVQGGLLELFTGGVGGFVSDLFGGGGPSKRELEQRQAESVAAGDIGALSSRLHAGATPEQILTALETPSADFSSIAARNPVRSFLEMPSEVAKEIGLPVLAPQDVPGEFTYLDPFTGTLAPHATHGRGEILQYGPGGQGIDRFRNAVQVPWEALSPQQFQAFLTRYAADPATVGQYVRGSGDVGYLPQGEAVAEASQAQNLTIDALNRLVAQAGPTSFAGDVITNPPGDMGGSSVGNLARDVVTNPTGDSITAAMSPGGGGLTELAEMLPV